MTDPRPTTEQIQRAIYQLHDICFHEHACSFCGCDQYPVDEHGNSIKTDPVHASDCPYLIVERAALDRPPPTPENDPSVVALREAARAFGGDFDPPATWDQALALIEDACVIGPTDDRYCRWCGRDAGAEHERVCPLAKLREVPDRPPQTQGEWEADLRQIEHECACGPAGGRYCPWCGNDEGQTHDATCPQGRLRAALATPWRMSQAREALEAIVCTEGVDAGVILLSSDSPTEWEPIAGCQVYKHENFSPLGDALIALHKLLSPPLPAPPPAGGAG